MSINNPLYIAATKLEANTPIVQSNSLVIQMNRLATSLLLTIVALLKYHLLEASII